ncbi:Arm DNA-binding domain-containing protein [Aquibacillus albus]|uniref:AP2-like integrase N-terminal domain-containing protein n=1 Tax=Aquibacillus albus TaxID=1168171 RepID=A0ABS2N440_9BACI|nr:Arm DNA-binding domain-containing protein [Aquibacillus albus]MBM7572892.1 hypothetical protein [Aquibacillus albus]
MASIRKRGQTWGYAVSHTVNGKTKQYAKSGFITRKEAQLAAAELKAN